MGELEFLEAEIELKKEKVAYYRGMLDKLVIRDKRVSGKLTGIKNRIEANKKTLKILTGTLSSGNDLKKIKEIVE